jgi:hypothetical protein
VSTPERRAALGSALRLMSRRAALIADQIEGLEKGDALRLRELAEQRAAVEAEFNELTATVPMPDAEAEPAPDPERWVRAALAELEREWAAEEEARERLLALGETALPLLRNLARDRAAVGDYVELANPAHALDVRF